MRFDLALSLILAFSGSAGQTSIPDVAVRGTNGAAIWIAESAAFTPEGDLRPEYFPDYTRARFDALRKKNGTDCVVPAISPVPENFLSTSSADALVGNSRTILTGEVVSARQGFFGQTPGTLYAVRIEEILKPRAQTIPAAEALFFISSARIETPKGLICAKPLEGSFVPAIGDHVLFFSYAVPTDSETRIYLVDPRRQLVVGSSTTIRMPPAIAEVGARHLEDVIAAVRERVGRESNAAR